MWYLASVPFLVHAVITAIDEFYFHRKRGLGAWERWGHPADTLTVLACYGMVLFLPPIKIYLVSYFALAIFSCLFVTKDEFVHAKECCASEIWLHSFLFLFHPILLTIAGLFWIFNGNQNSSKILNLIDNQYLYIQSLNFFKVFLFMQFFLTIFAFLFQLIYWNLIWKRKMNVSQQTK